VKLGGRVTIVKTPSHLEQFKGKTGYIRRMKEDEPIVELTVDLKESGERHHIKIPKSCVEELPS